ncbi:MAG: hypothetical protein ACFFAU_07820 [Candidatus Hodarchaeota archaeon]
MLRLRNYSTIDIIQAPELYIQVFKREKQEQKQGVHQSEKLQRILRV